MSRAKETERNDEGYGMREETSSGVELSLKKCLSLVYRGGEPPAPEIDEGGSKKRRLLSSMISVNNKQ